METGSNLGAQKLGEISKKKKADSKQKCRNYSVPIKIACHVLHHENGNNFKECYSLKMYVALRHL